MWACSCCCFFLFARAKWLTSSDLQKIFFFYLPNKFDLWWCCDRVWLNFVLVSFNSGSVRVYSREPSVSISFFFPRRAFLFVSQLFRSLLLPSPSQSICVHFLHAALLVVYNHTSQSQYSRQMCSSAYRSTPAQQLKQTDKYDISASTDRRK